MNLESGLLHAILAVEANQGECRNWEDQNNEPSTLGELNYSENNNDSE